MYDIIYLILLPWSVKSDETFTSTLLSISSCMSWDINNYIIGILSRFAN